MQPTWIHAGDFKRHLKADFLPIKTDDFKESFENAPTINSGEKP